MNKPPAAIAASADWDALLKALAVQPGGNVLELASRAMAMGVLAAPAAVARWIAERAPVLAERSSLRLLIIGAEKLDAVDGGRWYQWIPALLGRSLRVELTLVGDRLDEGFRSPLCAGAPPAQVRRHAGSLATFLDSVEAGSQDLAFLFHPGFPKHRGWLRDGSLARLLDAGVPLVAASYEADEYEMDRWVVQCHGFCAAGPMLLNPFYLDFSEPGTRVLWGRALWQFDAAVPAQMQVDDERLAALDRLGEMVMHSMMLNQTPAQAYGAPVDARAGDGSNRRLIYLFDEYLVDPAAAAILRLEDRMLERVGQLSESDLAAYPGADASDLARAVWAAGVKSRYLMHRYPPTVDPASARTLARSMHRGLERRIDALFEAD